MMVNVLPWLSPGLVAVRRPLYIPLVILQQNYASYI